MNKLDILKRTILKLDTFMIKNGQDMGLRNDIIEGINAYTGENSLSTIYINTSDSTLVPHVFVMPKYNKDFNRYVMNAEVDYHMPWGYTLELSQDAFKKFTAEELMALIIHAISQNVMSSSAKIRFLNAYSRALSEYRDSTILDAFEDLSHSEVCYIAYVDICSRPIRVKIENRDTLGTDEVLKTCGLDDAFDSAAAKIDGLTDNTSEQVVHKELEQDYKTMQMIFKAVMNNDIRHYFEFVKNAIPLITLRNITAAKKNSVALGLASDNTLTFVSDSSAPIVPMEEATIEYTPQLANMSLLESLSNPKNEEELRYQLDKVGVSIDYISTEDEKVSILYRIKVLKLRIMRTKLEIERKVKQKKLTPDEANYKLGYLEEFNEILDVYRKRTIEKKLKPRQVGLWAVYPEGYQY